MNYAFINSSILVLYAHQLVSDNKVQVCSFERSKLANGLNYLYYLRAAENILLASCDQCASVQHCH